MSEFRSQKMVFVAEFLADPMRNGTQAAIRAGYSANSAKEQAYQMLKEPEIAAAVALADAEQAERLQATADDVVLEMTRMAMFDPGQLTHVKTVDDIAKLPEDVRRAIVGWSWDRKGKLVLKLAKERAIEMLARRHGLFNDKVDHTVRVVGLAELMRQRAKKRLEQG